MIKAPKKLIEVALPLDDINAGAGYEKLPGIGAHPRGLHQWWARRPFAAARALLFAQLVNDPGGERGWGQYQGQSKEDAQKERDRLFDIIRKLADWKSSDDPEILQEASHEIIKSWKDTLQSEEDSIHCKLPAFHDPYAGGGAIPLEAARLGLETYATDLNPVAVLINKLMLEIPICFKLNKPVSTVREKKINIHTTDNNSIFSIASDFSYYGGILLKKAEENLKKHYPTVRVDNALANYDKHLKKYQGEELTVATWIWARAVESPNPAYSGCYTPLISSLQISNKKGKEYWILPEINSNRVFFKVQKGKINYWTKETVNRQGAVCLFSRTPIPLSYIRQQGKLGKLKKLLIAIVAQGNREKVYISPIDEHEKTYTPEPRWVPNLEISHMPRDIKTQTYGMTKFSDLFTPRQLYSLDTLCSILPDLRDEIVRDALKFGLPKGKPLAAGGTGATAYADAITAYLSFAIDRCADFNNSLTRWSPNNEKIMNLFSRQSMSIAWDFGEANIIENTVGGMPVILDFIHKCILKIPNIRSGAAYQADASSLYISEKRIISTDPPYFDNITYADLSDFFYVWLRRNLNDILPDIFTSIQTPKNDEAIAHPYRKYSVEPEVFFMQKLKKFFEFVEKNGHDLYPSTIYYAFKQSETVDLETVSTGWESFLEGLIDSGLSITATWPLRSEQSTRMLNMKKNALASSIVLVCRKRSNTNSISRRQFLRELKDELPIALEAMIGGKKGTSPIAPVDLAQSAIGPGMAIFSRYTGIIEADGSKMTVHDALIQINKVIDEYFNDAEGDMDSDTRFCIDWFMQYGFKQAEYGQADVLARAKGATVEGLAVAGVVESGGGKVRLLKFEEYPESWDPEKDTRIPTWEALHQLIRALRSGGEEKAGLLLKKMSERTESIRQLAYRLYTLCDRKGWAEEARAYNELIASWHGTIEAAENSLASSRQGKQLTLDI